MTRKKAPTAATTPLEVHLYGTRVAELSEDGRHRVTLTWTEEAVQRWGYGATPLSLSLPIGRGPVVGQHGAVAFTEGLLPEGALRMQTADLYDVPVDDALALLEIIGGECAGAVSIIPPERSAVAPTRPSPLSDADIAALLRGIDANPLGNDTDPGGVRLSLAGAQPKILLARIDGAWHRATTGNPSTHLVKPESTHRDYRGLPANEAFCMALARHAGIRAANSVLVEFDGIAAIAVERFDRALPTDGPSYPPERRHMEDFCSAWGIDVYDRAAKYNQKLNSFRRMAQTLRSHSADPPRDLRRLADLLVVNSAIGNADAHGRNYSVLIDPGGRAHLAPAYDLVSTVQYPGLDTKASMSIDGKLRIKEVGYDHLVGEVESWGLRSALAASLVSDALDRIAGAVAAAEEEVPEDAGRVAGYVRTRLDRFADPRARHAAEAGR